MEIFPSFWSNSKSDASKRVAVALILTSFFPRGVVLLRRILPTFDSPPRVESEAAAAEEEARMGDLFFLGGRGDACTFLTFKR